MGILELLAILLEEGAGTSSRTEPRRQSAVSERSLDCDDDYYWDDDGHVIGVRGVDDSPYNSRRDESYSTCGGEETSLSDVVPSRVVDKYANRNGRIEAATVARMDEKELLLELHDGIRGTLNAGERDKEGGDLSRLAVGSRVEVFVMEIDGEKLEAKFGLVPRALREWHRLTESAEKSEPIDVRVVSESKEGFSVAIETSIKAFLPRSELALDPAEGTDVVEGVGGEDHPMTDKMTLVGTYCRVKVMKLNKRIGEIVVSRKAYLEERERERLRSLEVERQ